MTAKPAETFPPHVYIAEEVEARGWSVFDLAREMRVPPAIAATVLTGVEPVSPLVARRLARAFGTSTELWLNLIRNKARYV